MTQLFRFPTASKRDSGVATWWRLQPPPLAEIARHWFEVMRKSGPDTLELLHDGHPTACVEDAAFAYVDTYGSHVNVGFFQGASLPDPHGLLAGTGKRMRHVKVKPGVAVNEKALVQLIADAHADMTARVDDEREE